MKIVFNKIITNKDTLKISLGSEVTTVEKPVSELLANGYEIDVDDCASLDNIQLGNKSVFKPSFTEEQARAFISMTRRTALVKEAQVKGMISAVPSNSRTNPYRVKLFENVKDFARDYSTYMSLPKGKYFDIKFSDKVTEIPERTYYLFPEKGIVSITIPVSVTKIGDFAFATGDSNGIVVNYEGSEEQWNAIEKTVGGYSGWNHMTPVTLNYNYKG